MKRNEKIFKILLRIAERVLGERLYTQKQIADMLYRMMSLEDISPVENLKGPSYYEELHAKNRHYISNNWLLSSLEEFRGKDFDILTELGCGNGLFSKAVADFVPEVNAVDWVKSDAMENLPENVTFLKRDICSEELPSSDICCSADFLEHLPFELLEPVVEKISKSAPFGYHVIACYNDGHSHSSVLPPWDWRKMFARHDEKYTIKKISFRRDRLSQQVAIISNF